MNDEASDAKRRLADCNKKLAALHYGALWRALVKLAAVCLLTAILVFVYAEGGAKWWGAPFLAAAAAIAAALPLSCARLRRQAARLAHTAEQAPPFYAEEKRSAQTALLADELRENAARRL